MPIVLKVGESGARVLDLERRLAAQGFQVGAQEGYFDEELQDALEQFQAAHLDKFGRPLKVDGEVLVGGNATWWALLHPSGSAQRQRRAPSKMDVADAAYALPAQRRALLATAAAEIGVREVPDGSNGGPRVDLYTGGWRVPWCALFVSWCIRTAWGLDRAFSPHRSLASVSKIRDWARANGRLYYAAPPSSSPPGDVQHVTIAEPQSGDVFLMLRPGGAVDAGRGHTGLVAEVLPGGAVGTVEGNCGNAVRTRVRPRSSVTAYVRVV